MNSDSIYVHHMLECMEDIATHLSSATSLGASDWSEHVTTREAIYHTLHTLAESGDKLSDAMRAAMPEVAWHEVKGLRNILVHEYLGDIDDSIINDVINNDLPRMKSALLRAKAIIDEEDNA